MLYIGLIKDNKSTHERTQARAHALVCVASLLSYTCCGGI